MKFVLTDTPRYWWPVTIRRPDPDAPGKIASQTLRVLFAPQTRDEAIADQEEIEAAETIRDRAALEVAQMLKVVKGWDDVVDPDKTPVPFSEDLLRQALQQSWVRTGLYAAYAESLEGQAARLGN